MRSFLWEFWSLNSLKHIIVRTRTTVKPFVSAKILCEYFCLDLHKWLNSSRHHVHWLTSKSHSFVLRKVQSQNLPILLRYFFQSNSLIVSIQHFVLCIFSSQQIISFMRGTIFSNRRFCVDNEKVSTSFLTRDQLRFWC